MIDNDAQQSGRVGFYRRHRAGVIISIVTGLVLASGSPFWVHWVHLQIDKLPFALPHLPQAGALPSGHLVVALGTKNEENLFVVEASSGTVVRQLTTDGGAGAPTLSQDRQTVFYADKSGVVLVVAVMGGDVSVLLRPTDDCPFVRHLSLARDRPHVLALQCRPLPVGGQSNLHDTLELVDLNGVLIRKLTPTTSRVDDPTLSPDGKHLAYWGSGDLTSATNGGSLFTISTDGKDTVSQLTQSANGVDADPAWSHDGTVLAFRRRENGTSSVYTLVPGADVERVNQGRGSFEKPSWSPDGKQIVSVSSEKPRKGQNRKYKLAVTELDTARTARSPRTYASIFAPAWDAR